MNLPKKERLTMKNKILSAKNNNRQNLWLKSNDDILHLNTFNQQC